MSNQSIFTVFVGKEIRAEFPVVIITSGPEPDTARTLFSEHFICLCSHAGTKFWSCRFNQRADSGIRDKFGINEAFMARQALEQAKFILARYLDDKYPSNDDLSFDKRDFCLKETEASSLIGLFLRGYLEKELNMMRQQTFAETLRQFLSEVLKLPKMISIDKI